MNSPMMSAGETAIVSLAVSNPCTHPVTETLQLYLRDLVATITRPLKELRSFQRITLAAGETRSISFPITDADLSFPGPDYQPLVEPGEFQAMIGTSSTELKSVRFSRLA